MLYHDSHTERAAARFQEPSRAASTSMGIPRDTGSVSLASGSQPYLWLSQGFLKFLLSSVFGGNLWSSTEKSHLKDGLWVTKV